MKKAQRYGDTGIDVSTLEEIYELTYKYQILKQEMELGDYGVPQTLPDRAYIAFHRIEGRLEEVTEECLDSAREVYRVWINEHEPDDYELQDMAYNNIREMLKNYEWGFASGRETLSDLADSIISEEDLREIVFDFLDIDPYDISDPHDEWMEYLKTVSSKTAQNVEDQTEFEFMETLPKMDVPSQYKELEKLTLEELENLLPDEKTRRELFEKIAEKVMENSEDMIEEEMDRSKEEYEKDTALGTVQEVYEQLEDYEQLSLDEQITLFQYALTTCHNNGEMAEYIVSGATSVVDAIAILDKLSAGEKVEDWDNELSKLLGYEVGSRSAPKDEWYRFSKRIARVIKILGQIKPGSSESTSDMFSRLYALAEKDYHQDPVAKEALDYLEMGNNNALDTLDEVRRGITDHPGLEAVDDEAYNDIALDTAIMLAEAEGSEEVKQWFRDRDVWI